MKVDTRAATDPALLREQYDARYSGDYMDSDAYSTWVHEGLAVARVRETLQVLPTPDRLLDYGCGQGKWVSLQRSLFPKAGIAGIDISAVAIEKATQKYPDCTFLPFDGTRAPFEDASFDMVFSFHVLEHVIDVRTTIHDMARLIRPGGHACIIFPCGNKGSFEERFVGLWKDGWRRTATGESIFFFEAEEGHLRRMESEAVIALFAQSGLCLLEDFYSGQFFASIDWLVRGTGPHYINGMFTGVTPRNRLAALQLQLLRRLLLGTHRFIGLRRIDLSRRRSPIKQAIARGARSIAAAIDRSLMRLAEWEWARRRKHRGGSVQYLVFEKTREAANDVSN